MRELKKVPVRGRIIGGRRPLICTPLVAKTLAEIPAAVEEILDLAPDLVEWRVDYFDAVDDRAAVLAQLDFLREKFANLPLIFTCRIDSEGGARYLREDRRLELIASAIASGKIDLVDVELNIEETELRDLVAAARARGVYVIISNHEFKHTPSVEEMLRRLLREEELGADIAKLAVMPSSTQDLLNLLQATTLMREEHTTIPLMTMSMSGRGLLSRIGGGTFGSAITFGAGSSISAPGQLPVAELRSILDLLERRA